MKNPSSITNPQLVSAMFAVVNRDTPETRQAMYRALLKSTLILPVAESLSQSSTPQRQTLTQDTSFKLLAAENNDGETILLAFSDEDAVRLWAPEGVAYVALKAPDLFAVAVRNDAAEVYLNPSGPVSGRILSHEFEVLAQRQLPFGDVPQMQTLPAGTRLLVSRPAAPPQAWRAEVISALSHHPQIVAAYLFQLHYGTETPRLVVGVQFTSESEDSTRNAIMQAILSAVGQPPDFAEDLHFVVLEADDFLRIVRDTVPRLYSRDESL
ncbi:MAG: enhanced serine sensitivity protein SseB C-terminal domain-containing protein [Anaerolineae bacterium]|nr:enhanced serine sensitivity protein SseB C-terminal domain-containing protein [Anaerolineae bacterium]